MAGVRKKPLCSGRYQGWFTNFKGDREYFTGSYSMKKTLENARHLEDEHRQIRNGMRPVPSSMKPDINRSFRDVAAEYLEWGHTQGGRGGRAWGKTHAKERRNKLAWWEKRLKLRTMADMYSILPKVEREIQRLRNGGYDGSGTGVSGKTLSNYIESLRSFCNWAVKHGYLDSDPLENISKFDKTPQTQRRALTPEEIRRLLEKVPEHRRILYEVAMTTGLRAGELRALTLEHLDEKKSEIILDPAWTKNRKGGSQPIPRELMKKLLEFGRDGKANDLYAKRYSREDAKEDKIPDKPLLYVSTHPARELRKDLEDADVAYNIPGEGKVDFHSFRVTYVTLVFEAGANPKEGQTLARHASPQLTMNVYARARNERLAELVDKLGKAVLEDSERANSVQMCRSSTYSKTLSPSLRGA